MQTLRSIALGLGLGLVLTLVFAAGFLLNDAVRTPAIAQAGAGEGSFALLDEVQGLLDHFFVREQPDYRERQYAAVRGLVASLNDPYTFFIEPSTAASESDVLAGVYGGVGVQVVRDTAGELVLYPFDDGPAQAAGIEAGDRLLAVDEVVTGDAMSLDVVDQLLRGEVREGNGVTMSIRRGEDEFPVFVEFAVINVPSVLWRIIEGEDTLGYIQILRFSSLTPEELRTAADELRAAGVRALVLDLRDNSGGLLQESIEVADAFIDSGVLLFERSPDGEKSYDATAGGFLADWPVVALVNQRTASGAEIVAGALRDSGRAQLFGERTYGKGTVQQIVALSDTSSLHVTSAEWFTPTRAPLDQVGLEPDRPLTPDPDGHDNVLAAAIEALQAELSRTGTDA